ncbi:tetratricopeptide repeat protein [Aliagarivorans taiwanensis]|uniref:tetratricopeptide repeat protein n=1 Tax=Aliagarivorans taiwanensis TaxID=561966 RepID=UPI0003F67EF2|nr:SEL1-like repeat protein [Aliagarivorans taiwanensis]
MKTPIALSLALSMMLSGQVVAETVADISVDDEAGEQQAEEVEFEPLYETEPPQLAAIEIYEQDDLIGWINLNQHLNRVKEDDCQLVQDIEARAEKVAIPAYEFLWGDMLAWGVCVEPDPELGVHYMWQAANQGLAAALEQLGRYYANGILVQRDYAKAIPLLREASAQGFLKAQLQFVELLVAGQGSPLDYEDGYRWLHHAIIADRATHKQAEQLLAALANKMPAHVVAKAKASNQPY